MLLLGSVLVYLFLQLHEVLQKDFAEVPQRLQEGSMVNLNSDRLDQRIKFLLEKEFYFEDPRDVQLAYSVVARGMSADDVGMDNIGELNKQRFSISTQDALDKGGISFRKRAILARTLIGFSGDDSLRYEQEKNSPPQLASNVSVGMGQHGIRGRVRDAAGTVQKGLLVRLQLIMPDSLVETGLSDTARTQEEHSPSIHKTWVLDSGNKKSLLSLKVYARTDQDGRYAFLGLPNQQAYEVIPLSPGKAFGSSKGVMELSRDSELNFTASEHRIKLFSTRDFNNLKKEKALIVRTPEEVER